MSAMMSISMMRPFAVVKARVRTAGHRAGAGGRHAVDQDGLGPVGRGRGAAEHRGLTGDGLGAENLLDRAVRAGVDA